MAVAVHREIFNESQGVYHRPLCRPNFDQSSGYHNRTVNRPQVSPTDTAHGKRYKYGGVGQISLTAIPRPNEEAAGIRNRMHTHHVILPDPRHVKINQNYDVTSLQKSLCRADDELVENMNKINLKDHMSALQFPASHPYGSHIPSKAMFPSFDPPKRPAAPSTYHHVLEGDEPSAAPIPTIIGKARGSMGRHEVVKIPLDTMRKPMTWPKHEPFFQVAKGMNGDQNWFYPVPTLLGKRKDEEATESYSKELCNVRSKLNQTNYQAEIGKSLPESSEIALQRRLDAIKRDIHLNAPSKTYTESLIKNVPPNALSENNEYGRHLVKLYTDSDNSSDRFIKSANTTRRTPILTTNRVKSCMPKVGKQHGAEKEGNLLNDMRHLYSKSATHKKFHGDFPDETKDLRKYTNERRHYQELKVY